MRLPAALLVGIIPLSVSAQHSVTEYSSAQRAAMQSVMDKDSSLAFIPETWFNANSLRYARTDPEMAFGKAFKPYYQVGDFNHDGRKDFAVLLLRGNAPDLGMTALVFNGTKNGGFRLAHREDEPFSELRFLKVTEGKLWIGVMESDEAGCFVPAGTGYIVEPCNS